MTAPMGEKIEALIERWRDYATQLEKGGNHIAKGNVLACASELAALLREQAPRAEPVAWRCKDSSGCYDYRQYAGCNKCEPLYTAPPPHAAAPPEEGEKILTVGSHPHAVDPPSSVRVQTDGGSVPQFKFDAIVEDCKRLEQELRKARQVERLHRDKEHGDYWAWGGNGEDHPESLVCPVLVPAAQVRAWIAASRLTDGGAAVEEVGWLIELGAADYQSEEDQDGKLYGSPFADDAIEKLKADMTGKQSLLGRTRWFVGDPDCKFTTDSLKAMRFARSEDACLFAMQWLLPRMKELKIPKRHRQVKFTEHIWANLPAVQTRTHATQDEAALSEPTAKRAPSSDTAAAQDGEKK